ncbi:class I SAM-dependent methyltransferase [Fodinicurvata sediminis]|uniref:class I SAM-dependent methyltransferase n=1 Tax=Fodinicurvata sediminis TaxID=1121832 RepID=UPI0004158241|nr:class I SAM-dependent methyltransferase [Fodinicurvata sediminis]
MHNEHYKHEYTEEFASRWDDLIGWEGRQEGEAGFFEKLLEQHNCQRVADIATGTGYHAVTLALNTDLDVVATDGSANMIEQTKRNAKQHNADLEDIAVVDWRELADHYGEESFDALLCLGNAFSHLFEHEARVEALEAMFKALRPGGILVLDHRNYDRILDEGFSTKHEFYYTGDNVDARPVEISPQVMRFEYTYPDKSKYHLNLFPLRYNYMVKTMKEAGFKDVESYGDFTKPYKTNEVDFIQQVAIKAK